MLVLLRLQGWSAVTSGSFKCHRINGNHLWPLDKVPKQQWLARIVEELQTSLPL
jgi:surfactin synthase thioesterase subunit